jgi:hypothetical protein
LAVSFSGPLFACIFNLVLKKQQASHWIALSGYLI